MKIFKSLNKAVQTSLLRRFYEFDARELTFLKEVQGGTATYLIMAYIFAVNPMILGAKCELNFNFLFTEVSYRVTTKSLFNHSYINFYVCNNS